MEVKNYGEPHGWIIGQDFPEWGNTPEYVNTISKGYLVEGETPREAYRRVAETIAKIQRKALNAPTADMLFDYIWKGWLCLASPVLANTGTERGLPISCYGIDVADSVLDIGEKNLELMLLAKNGGGVGICLNQLRGAGSPITGNGTADGVVPFCKMYDSTILATSQGSVRRGAASLNLNIEHPDFMSWLKIREPLGDINRQCLNIHQCAIIGDKFMRKIQTGDPEARHRWIALLQQRKATGEPYIMFRGNVNKTNPSSYQQNGLKVYMTNICTEIVLHTDQNHSFVCCLSSLNLAKFDEWKGTPLIRDAIWFLDGVMEHFIQKAKYRRGFENAVRSAEKGRALGLGVLGYHTFLQDRRLPVESLAAEDLNTYVFNYIKSEADQGTRDLADAFGEPLWCRGSGRRNTHLIALAPTVSNSKLAGGVSAGIEPVPANCWTEQSAKGTFLRKNPALERELECLGLNTPEMWAKISSNRGSLQEIPELKEVYVGGYRLTDVYKTFREINQLELVQQAGQRQPYVDQAQSLTLAFPVDATPEWIHKVHFSAWEMGVKTLYYMRTGSSLKGDVARTAVRDCVFCEA